MSLSRAGIAKAGPASAAAPPLPGSAPAWNRKPLLLATLLILALGAVEDIYGSTDSGDVYGSDAVQYLDIARALARHDWHSVLNPLWSQGYPMLLALTRPLFPHGPGGDWWTSRFTSFAAFAMSYAAFLYLFFTLSPPPSKSNPAAARHWQRQLFSSLILFASAQICLGQVSRVNPDELVTAFFLLACAQLVRLVRPPVGATPRDEWAGSLLGMALGLGFLVKAAVLGLGCDMLAITAIALYGKRAKLRPVIAAAVIFISIVGIYGVALSHATGYTTLGDSGAINYAWHVNRLQKWVHWEGGVQTADEAWPKPAIARFAQWSTRPPDFGKPMHPSVILQESPRVYGFAAPVHATYVPYFDPPYFYQGYRDVFRVRYQFIALGKSLGDLLQVLLEQPIAWALALWLLFQLHGAPSRRSFRQWMRVRWALLVCALLGVALYLPVHLEGRYIAGMLLVLGTCCVLAASGSGRDALPPAEPGRNLRRMRPANALLLLGFLAELGMYQTPVWRNLLHRKSPSANADWRMGVAAMEQELPPGASVGVISWTPNLHSDWAYIAHLEITSEIASGPDYDQFWHLPAAQQEATLAIFRRAGAVAVFVNGKPPGLGGSEWRQLNGTSLWMARLP